MNVGDKVVCVDGSFATFPLIGVNTPDQDKVYVIRGILEGLMNGRRATGILLVGIQNKLSLTGQEYSFHIARFRKLDDLKEQARKRLQRPAMPSR